MRRDLKLTMCLAGWVALAGGAAAAVNPAGDRRAYHAIAERNVFDLKPPTPPPPPAPAVTTAPPNVKLTGITTILGNKRALFMVQEAPAPGKAQKQESYILTEGQRQGLIEVLEIDERTGRVKIKNDGSISVVTFETVKLPVAPVGVPPSLAGGVPVPPPMPNGMTPQPAGNLTPPPTRTSRTPTGEPETQLSPEAQAILMEAERERARSLGEAAKMPPLPPTGVMPNLQPSLPRNRQSNPAILPSLPVH
jgi:hypothetical protein